MRCLVLAALCATATAAPAQTAKEEALVREVFRTLNPKSIRLNVEFCGYLGYTASGALVASRPTRGTLDSCLADDPPEIELIVASYHTHGAFSREYYNEIPSGDDMEGDEEEGIDGWVATPGGRLWFIDTDEMVTYQVCGIGCLPSDPQFVEGDMGRIEPQYTYDDLVRTFFE